MKTPPSPDAPPTGLTPVVERNISALLERHRQTEQRQSLQERMAARITRFSGSMAFVYLHLGVFGFWIVAHVAGPPFPQWDPTLVILAMVASVEAIFLSTFVLITQNRLASLAEKRSDLHLHIGLLAEHEITRLITLTSAIAEKLDLPDSLDPHLDELKQDVSPEDVLATLEAKHKQSEDR